jgi:hypothetical protein
MSTFNTSIEPPLEGVNHYSPHLCKLIDTLVRLATVVKRYIVPAAQHSNRGNFAIGKPITSHFPSSGASSRRYAAARRAAEHPVRPVWHGSFTIRKLTRARGRIKEEPPLTRTTMTSDAAAIAAAYFDAWKARDFDTFRSLMVRGS